MKKLDRILAMLKKSIRMALTLLFVYTVSVSVFNEGLSVEEFKDVLHMIEMSL